MFKALGFLLALKSKKESSKLNGPYQLKYKQIIDLMC